MSKGTPTQSSSTNPTWAVLEYHKEKRKNQNGNGNGRSGLSLSTKITTSGSASNVQRITQWKRERQIRTFSSTNRTGWPQPQPLVNRGSPFYYYFYYFFGFVCFVYKPFSCSLPCMRWGYDDYLFYHLFLPSQDFTGRPEIDIVKQRSKCMLHFRLRKMANVLSL